MSVEYRPPEAAGACLTLAAPTSKSQTQRALLLAALSPGQGRLLTPLECDDTRHLRRALEQLGVACRDPGPEPGAQWLISGGVHQLRAPDEPLDCGEGGTTLRFLAPLSLLLQRGRLLLKGQGRLRTRPVAELGQALEQLGVELERPPGGQALPLGLRGPLARGRREVTVDASRSRQFLSGLMMVGPCLPHGLQLHVPGPLVSRPYVDLTLAALARHGVQVVERSSGAGRLFSVPPAVLSAGTAQVEGDWSGAAFLLAAAWLTRRPLVLTNLDRASAQGDRVMLDQLGQLWRPGAAEFDLTHCPDLIAPLAAACALAPRPCRILGAAHARLKESDRVAVLCAGLRAVGVQVEELPDGLQIRPAATLAAATLDPAGDHRMAMAFGLLSLRQRGIVVADRACVGKSYPGFWRDLERFGR